MRSYEIPIDPRNARVTTYFGNSDPADDPTYGSLVNPGHIWVKTTNDAAPYGTTLDLSYRDTDDTWKSIFGSIIIGGDLDADTLDGFDSLDFQFRQEDVQTITGNHTITEDDVIIVADASGGNITVSLPPAADVDGQTFMVFMVAGGPTNTVTIEPDGAEEIGGASNRVLDSNYEGSVFVASGPTNEWLVVARPGQGTEPEGAAGGDLTGNYPNPTIEADVDLTGDPTIDGQPIAKVPAIYVVSTTTYTFDADDAGNYGRFTNAAGCAITVPANGSVPFPVGTELPGIGTLDQLEFIADTGVTINTAHTLFTRAPFSVFQLKKVGTNEWDLFGDLEPA